jgi:4-alpha-glucanotransferase
MSDGALLAEAAAAGIATRWKDVFGVEHEVAAPSLRAILAALGPDEGGETLPPLLTAAFGEPVRLPGASGAFRLVREDGEVLGGMLGEGGWLPGIEAAGYHSLSVGDQTLTLAVAPRRCFGTADAGVSRPWGLAVQLYSLRRANDGGIGDFAALREFVTSAARHGAHALAISPVHAQFSADPDRFSPYAPSSRVMLNVVHAACDLPDAASPDLVDWPGGTRARLLAQRERFASALPDPAFAKFRAEHGELLESHARFEALHAHLYGRDPKVWHWRDWPAELQDPRGPAVAKFAAEHAQEVDFHAWLQFQADEGLAEAQAAAKAAGMPIGLISDLAVGTDGGGSHAWSRQDEMLLGLTVGAPPDLLSPQGQNWGLLAFSPRGLRTHGYSAFIEMLRAAFRHAGGVRIDHVMGLARLWVVPDGAAAGDGAYVAFPQLDMIRLVAIESWRHRAIVLGEDLGTLPEGFQPLLEGSGVLGLRVLWFERLKTDLFSRPSTWSRGAVAMTSTHDLPTVAGWWEGRDLEWRSGLGLLRDEPAERAARERDRTLLWDAMRDSGVASGERPAEDGGPRVTDAAVAHVGGAACDLVLLPLEDALAQTEQPNLPGTLDEHPNWRRRTTEDASVILDRPDVAARLASLAAARADRP